MKNLRLIIAQLILPAGYSIRKSPATYKPRKRKEKVNE